MMKRPAAGGSGSWPVRDPSELARTTVPPEIAGRIDVWAGLLLEARTVWNGIVAGFSVVPSDRAPVTNEDTYLREKHPDWGEHPAWQAGMAAAKLVDVASHHALGVRAQINDRQLVFGLSPLVRAEVEHLARACWILDPEVSPPEVRVARLWLEYLHGAQRQRITWGELGDRVEERRAKQLRECVQVEIEKWFPGSNTTCGAADEPIEWLVAGETYPSLQRVSKRLERIFGDEVPGLYAILSHSTHPNLQEIDAITDGDLRTSAFNYRVSSESTITEIGNAAVLLNLATSLVALYFGIDQATLHAWHRKAVRSDPGYFGLDVAG